MTLDQLKDRCRLEDGHWLWAGALSEGWPRVWAPDFTLHKGELKTQTGRRAVWHIKTGKPIAAGYRVFGTCKEKTCINPAHLECLPVGQQGAKVAASGELKGRIRRITANRATGRKRSHLSPEKIEQIRSSDKTGLELAAELSVSRSTVSRVRTGKQLAFDAVGGMFTGLMSANDTSRRVA